MKTPSPKTTRRGRPARSDQQAEASRSLIVESARKLFAAEGYEGVSMRKIAAIAQCSPAALYTLFPNKRQLLRGIWEELFFELLVQMDGVYASAAAQDRVEAICLAFVDFWLQRQDDYRAIFMIEDRLQGEQDSYFVDSAQVMQRMAIFRRSISEAQARGELRAGDPVEMQNVLLCGVQGIALNLIGMPEVSWGDPDKLKRATIHALITGLR
ncbi:TetR/AcrR family transcriptional regulator [Solimonas sp. K1W22B-7]|uniref:TetR/AcrR family transcriptional regulator n=1 Tax=Solimonas sp. K1W22B-7 TaxID=2303331 RepID=UPI000E332079|nr:TetR/AcrR family transcriptional regulator [Solimonas sp. K1W22B-7]AXQ31096.1 TetR/AcrR family transcriptional regulator [Solimonas sp. K1W22B-7]